MTAARIVRWVTILALLGAGVAAAALLWQTDVPDGLRLDVPAAEAAFTEPVLEEARDYARPLRWLWAASTAAQLALLGFLAVRGPRLAARLPGGGLRRGLLLLALVLAAAWLVRLPFRAVGHWWRREHGLSDQPYLAWLVSPWLETLGAFVVVAVALAAGMLLARRLGPGWWKAGGPALAALGAAAILLQPLTFAPRLEPLEDEELAAEIRALARELGVAPVETQVKEARDRTTRINAEVAGIGPSRRVLLWDTLFEAELPEASVRFIAAHELAHVSERHLWKGVAWFALLATPGVWLLARATRPLGGLGRPGAVPLAVLLVVVVQLAALPFANAVSRRYEAEADWVALRATQAPEGAEALFRAFAVRNLAQPDPPGWSRFLLGSHPSLLERLAMADAWARERG